MFFVPFVTTFSSQINIDFFMVCSLVPCLFTRCKEEQTRSLKDMKDQTHSFVSDSSIVKSKVRA